MFPRHKSHPEPRVPRLDFQTEPVSPRFSLEFDLWSHRHNSRPTVKVIRFHSGCPAHRNTNPHWIGAE